LFAAFNILLVRFRGNAGFGGGGAGTGIVYLLSKCSSLRVCFIQATSVFNSERVAEMFHTAANMAARPMALTMRNTFDVFMSSFTREYEKKDSSTSSSGERFRNQDQHDAYGNA
jgi:hypothetical protein